MGCLGSAAAIIRGQKQHFVLAVIQIFRGFDVPLNRTFLHSYFVYVTLRTSKLLTLFTSFIAVALLARMSHVLI